MCGLGLTRPGNGTGEGRPKAIRTLSRLRPKLTIPSRLSVPSFGGSGRTSVGSPIDPSKTPALGVLRVQVLAARNLAAKDRNGMSDPYVQLRTGDQRVASEVVKASLNPIWGDLPDGVKFHGDGHSRKPVIVDTPVYQDHIDRQRIEVVAWDKDRFSAKCAALSFWTV